MIYLIDLLKYLDLIAPAIILVAVLFLVLAGRMRLRESDRILLYFILLQFACNGFATIMQDYKINNHVVYVVNCICTQYIFSKYYWYFPGYPILRKMIPFGYTIFFFLGTLLVLFVFPLNEFNSYLLALGSLVIAVYCLTDLSIWLEAIPNSNILRHQGFWVSAGILFYFGSSFFIFLSYHYLSIYVKEEIGIVWRIHNCFLAIACLLFYKAMLTKEWIQRLS